MPDDLVFDSVSFSLKGNTVLKMSADEFAKKIGKMILEAFKDEEVIRLLNE